MKKKKNTNFLKNLQKKLKIISKKDLFKLICTQEKEIIFLRKITIIFSLLGIIIFALLITIQVNHIINQIGDTQVDEALKGIINITYKDLNLSERNHFEELLFSVNKMYLTKNHNFFVLKDLSNICNCTGRNVNDGESIFIEYSSKEDLLKNRITHELLHSYFKNDGVNEKGELTLNHKIIYDLAIKEVVYDDRKTIK